MKYRALGSVALLLVTCCGCGSLTRYYHIQAPTSDEVRVVRGCLEDLRTSGFEPAERSRVRLGKKEFKAICCYKDEHGASLTFAEDASNTELIVLPHPVPSYSQEPRELREARERFENCAYQQISTNRLELVEDWHQNWIWNFIRLAP